MDGLNSCALIESLFLSNSCCKTFATQNEIVHFLKLIFFHFPVLKSLETLCVL